LKLTVEIDSDNDDRDFASMLATVVRKVHNGETSGGVYDTNGNYVGQFYFTGLAATSDTILMENQG
jgi:hypothetical protein